jgi:hypothetical protein
MSWVWRSGRAYIESTWVTPPQNFISCEFGVHFVSAFRQCSPIRFMVKIEDAKSITHRSEKERGSNYLFLVLRSFQFACGSQSNCVIVTSTRLCQIWIIQSNEIYHFWPLHFSLVSKSCFWNTIRLTSLNNFSLDLRFSNVGFIK